MEFENRRYVIFNTTELDQIDFDQVLETSAETVRRSVDGTETFVKYENSMPGSVDTLLTRSEPYNHEEILAILNTADWSTLISTV